MSFYSSFSLVAYSDYLERRLIPFYNVSINSNLIMIVCDYYLITNGEFRLIVPL